MGFLCSLCSCLLLLAAMTHSTHAAPGLGELFDEGKTYSYSVTGRVVYREERYMYNYLLNITSTARRRMQLMMTDFQLMFPPGVDISQWALSMMQSPTKIVLSDEGSIHEINVVENLPPWAINLKREQIYGLMVELGEERRAGWDVGGNEVRSTGSSDMVIDGNNEWKSVETTILGDCQVSYRRTEITSWLRAELSGGSTSSSEEVQGDVGLLIEMERRYCSAPGTKFFMVTKTMNSGTCAEGSFGAGLNDKMDEESTFRSDSTFCGMGNDFTLLKVGRTSNIPQVVEREETFTLLNVRSVSSHPIPQSGDGHPIIQAKHKLPFEMPLQRMGGLGWTAGYISSAIQDLLTNFKVLHGLDPRLPGFRDCLRQNQVPSSRLIDPVTKSSAYNTLNFQWNTKFEKVYPIAFFLPLITGHVQMAVKCGVLSQISLIPNSGGHSYDSISWGDNSTLIIDFQEMNKVELVQPDSIAKIQPGALVGPVTAQLWGLGKVGIPVGNCLTVGVGGHALGGGIGLFSMVYGLLIDNVVEYEMVDAKGDVVVASKDANPDLFWALRGVGPGFIGIITSFKIKTFQADKMKISVVKMVYPLKDFAKVARATQDWIEWTRQHEPMVVTMALAFSDDWNATNPVTPGGPEPGIIVSAAHIHDPVRNPSSNATFLKQIGEMFPPGGKKVVKFPSYLETHFATGYAPVILPKPANPILPTSPISPEEYILGLMMKMSKPIAIPRYFKSKSFFVKRKLTNQEIERIAEIMSRIPNNNAGLLLNTEQGAIRDIAANASAYVHRNVAVQFRAHIELSPKDVGIEEAEIWLEDFWAAVQSFDSGQTYQNFPDLDVDDYLQRYYGENLPRLGAAKKKWDPTNYFRNKQSLPISMEGIREGKLAAFRSCLTENEIPVNIHLVDPVFNVSDYETLNLQWNTKIAKAHPIAYFFPYTSAHVQVAVRCGLKGKIHIIQNSGGHSDEASSWGDNSTVIVDFRHMTKVEL